MTRRRRKGFYAKGEFVAEGSERETELREDEASESAPSRSQRKRESAELQKLGERILDLRGPESDRLVLPERLADALAEARRITDFEGRRRQLQYVGRLMRGLEETELETIRHALEADSERSRRETASLHRAETWRRQLIESDSALADWIALYPETDVQRLRTFVRQARQVPPAGQGERAGRAFREIFRIVREQLDAPR